MEYVEFEALKNLEELRELVDLANKEIYKLANVISQKRTKKPISKHERQVQLKIIASAERMCYEN